MEVRRAREGGGREGWKGEMGWSERGRERGWKRDVEGWN